MDQLESARDAADDDAERRSLSALGELQGRQLRLREAAATFGRHLRTLGPVSKTVALPPTGRAAPPSTDKHPRPFSAQEGAAGAAALDVEGVRRAVQHREVKRVRIRRHRKGRLGAAARRRPPPRIRPLGDDDDVDDATVHPGAAASPTASLSVVLPDGVQPRDSLELVRHSGGDGQRQQQQHFTMVVPVGVAAGTRLAVHVRPEKPHPARRSINMRAPGTEAASQQREEERQQQEEEGESGGAAATVGVYRAEVPDGVSAGQPVAVYRRSGARGVLQRVIVLVPEGCSAVS